MSRLGPIGKTLGRARRVVSDELVAAWHSLPVRSDTVLWESFSGNGALCNPEAIFRRCLADPELAHLRHTWVISDPAVYASTVEELVSDPRVDVVRYRSPQYFRKLTTAQYLVNNATFPQQFVKRPGQVYPNTWHGTPLKTMGYDMPGGAYTSANVLRNFVSADFLLSANSYMTETMYRDAYRLDHVYQGRVIEAGHPRCDHQFADVTRDELARHGVALSDGPIVLYAPTWRGDSFHGATAETKLLREGLRELQAGAPANATVLLKVHQQVFAELDGDEEFASRLVPNHLPTNRLLAISDVLVTDYSSVFFDYLSLDRPIVFDVPDLRSYESSRGWYIGIDDWPGQVVRDRSDLASAIRRAASREEPAEVTARRRAASERFCGLDDGAASQRVADIVFKGERPAEHLVELSSTEKPRVLVYLGGMRSNGITAAALGLLDNLDHDALDVSVMYAQTRNSQCRDNIAAIHPAVRHFARGGRMLMSNLDRYGRSQLTSRGDAAEFLGRRRLDRLFRTEWRRVFGDCEFDHVIDFSGYAAFWAYLLLAGRSSSSSVWLHNDLDADAKREIDGHRPHERSLGAIFTLYHRFDHLVSVSSPLAEINRTKLGDYAPAERFGYASNALSTDRIDEAVEPLESAIARRPPELLDGDDLGAALDDLLGRFDDELVMTALRRRQLLDHWMPDRTDVTTFVAVGRLSPEKNHARLVRAFAKVHQHTPRTRLLVLGDGPLKPMLTTLAADLGVEASVSFAGHQGNPWVLMAECDCFVMSSDYEGQPMVILEARYLGLPVVVTRFDSAPGALGSDEGLVVDRSVDALADGMRRFLDGEVPFQRFDVAEYNARAIGEFEQAVGLS